MEYAVGIPDRFGRQRGLIPAWLSQVVEKLLDGMGVQLLQPDRSEGGLDINADILVIVLHCKWFYPSKIVMLPDIQPLPHSHFAGGGIGATVDCGHGLGQLLPDLLLRGTVVAGLDLLAPAGIGAYGIAGLPPAVWPLADAAAALGVSFSQGFRF